MKATDLLCIRSNLFATATFKRRMNQAFSPIVSVFALLFSLAATVRGQTLINVDFGASAVKTGFAATGQTTNDFWNGYRHYEPRFIPGMPLVPDDRLNGLKLWNGSPTSVS